MAFMLSTEDCTHSEVIEVRQYMGSIGYGVTTVVCGGGYEVYTEHNFPLANKHDMDISYLDDLGYSIVDITKDNYREVI